MEPEEIIFSWEDVEKDLFMKRVLRFSEKLMLELRLIEPRGHVTRLLDNWSLHEVFCKKELFNF